MYSDTTKKISQVRRRLRFLENWLTGLYSGLPCKVVEQTQLAHARANYPILDFFSWFRSVVVRRARVLGRFMGSYHDDAMPLGTPSAQQQSPPT